MPLIHSEKLNSCRCGSTKKPNLDSDDMIPCWTVECFDCGQSRNDKNWTMSGAVKAWNSANPIIDENNIIQVAERLYYQANPKTKMDVPSYAYEQVESASKRWMVTKSKLSLYNWCKQEQQKNETHN